MECSLLAVPEGRLGGGASGGGPTRAGRRGPPHGVDAIARPCGFSRRSTSVAHVGTDRTAEAITTRHHRLLPSFLLHVKSSQVHQGATARMPSPRPHGSRRPLSSSSASLVPALRGSQACLSVVSPWESSTAPVVLALPDHTSSAVWSPRNRHPSPTTEYATCSRTLWRP